MNTSLVDFCLSGAMVLNNFLYHFWLHVHKTSDVTGITGLHHMKRFLKSWVVGAAILRLGWHRLLEKKMYKFGVIPKEGWLRCMHTYPSFGMTTQAIRDLFMLRCPLLFMRWKLVWKLRYLYTDHQVSCLKIYGVWYAGSLNVIIWLG